MNAVAKIEPTAQNSVVVAMAERFGMNPAAFEATVRATVCKGNVSREEFAAFLLVAKEHRLNPLLKEVYAFPAKGGGIQPIVSIDGWARIINEHPQLNGVEFTDIREEGELIAVECRMYRKDRDRPTTVIEYMAECRRNTDVWKQWPARMLRHKALIQCARYAFGFSGIVDPDEYERGVSPERQRPAEVARLHADFEEPAAPALTHDPQPAADAEFSEHQNPQPSDLEHQGGEASPEAGPQAEASLGRDRTGTPAGREGISAEGTGAEQSGSAPPTAGLKKGSEITAPEYLFDDPSEFAGAAPDYLDRIEQLADLTALWTQWQPELQRLRRADLPAYQEVCNRKNARKRELEAEEARA